MVAIKGDRLQNNPKEPISKPCLKSISEFKKFQIAYMKANGLRVCIDGTSVVEIIDSLRSLSLLPGGGEMPDKQTIFLSIDEAVEAVHNDFSQYPSQFNLLSTLWPMVFGSQAYLMRDPDRSTVWIKTSDANRLRQVPIDVLGQWIVRRLKQVTITVDHLARICSLVFQTPVVAGPRSVADPTPGIWVHTGMGDFVCRQCGRCCQALDYRDGCTVADYQRWQDRGRTDILAWVGTVAHAGEVTSCQIWMVPGTNQFADVCPWLNVSQTTGRSICSIYDVRPMICRQYPGSRKHARMTGCRGL